MWMLLKTKTFFMDLNSQEIKACSKLWSRRASDSASGRRPWDSHSSSFDFYFSQWLSLWTSSLYTIPHEHNLLLRHFSLRSFSGFKNILLDCPLALYGLELIEHVTISLRLLSRQTILSMYPVSILQRPHAYSHSVLSGVPPLSGQKD